MTQLYELANTFRHALISCPKDGFSDFLRRHLEKFPIQSCDVASLLLAHYLRDHGYRTIERVFGLLPDNESHVWLEVDGLIVDITADQFQGVDDPIIITEGVRQSWHSQISVHSREPAYSENAVRQEYEMAYAAIKYWLASQDSTR